MSDQSTQAAVALARMDGHEKVCAERYGEIKESFGRVHGRIDWIMYTTIITALAAIGTLLTMVLNK